MLKLTPARALVALAAILLALLAFAASASIVVARKNPELALTLWPAHGAAAARAANKALLTGMVLRQEEPGSEGAAIRSASHLARRSLANLALNPIALRTIALAELEGEPGQIALLEQAARLSRRDSLTQITLINEAALAGDSRRALAHYDALLRRDTPFRDIAGRTLAHALSEPQFVDSIAGLLRRDPPWKSLLYHYAVRDPAAWDGFLALHGKLRGDVRVPTAASAQFAAALAAAGRIDDASRVAALAGAKPLARTTGLSDTRFETGDPFPGGWDVPATAGASLQPFAEEGALLSYARGRSGTLARRLVALAPGRYRAVLARGEASGGDSAEAGAVAEARLECVRAQAPGLGSSSLVVGAGCPFQWLSIVLPDAPRYDGEIYLRSIEALRDG